VEVESKRARIAQFALIMPGAGGTEDCLADRQRSLNFEANYAYERNNLVNVEPGVDRSQLPVPFRERHRQT
jgi:hypothetical protein